MTPQIPLNRAGRTPRHGRTSIGMMLFVASIVVLWIAYVWFLVVVLPKISAKVERESNRAREMYEGAQAPGGGGGTSEEGGPYGGMYMYRYTPTIPVKVTEIPEYSRFNSHFGIRHDRHPFSATPVLVPTKPDVLSGRIDGELVWVGEIL